MFTKNVFSLIILFSFIFQTTFIKDINFANAEIQTDQSFGNARSIESVNNVYIIDDILGFQKGTNLFHSFESFNLESGKTALFSGPTNVERIITRVTGGKSSSINGTISSSINGADLFFLNPNGVLFGENAQLKIDGSFYVSTADYLQLGQSERFFSQSTSTEGLVSSPPQSFGFLNSNIAPIEFKASGKITKSEDSSPSAIEESFGVNGSNNFYIVGGKITIDQGAVLSIKDNLTSEIPSSSISVENNKGTIQIISVKDSSNIYFTESDLDFSQVETFDDIILKEYSQLNVSGQNPGNIKLAGQNILVDQSICASDNFGNLNGGIIEFIGENITIANKSKITAHTNANGNASSIHLLSRSDTIITGLNSYIQSFSGDKKNDTIIGKTGYISISARNIFIKEGGSIIHRSFSLGDCSNIDLKATDTISLSSKEEPYNSSSIMLNTYRKNVESGDGGNITLNADNIYLSEGARLSTSTRGSGKGGNINLFANNNVHLYGERVAKTSLQPQKGCSIYVRTYADMEDAGNSGNVLIEAKNITMEDGASIKAETSSTGRGGHVTLVATEDIVLKGDGRNQHPTVIDLSCIKYLSNDNTGKGDAGDLNITAKNITIKDGAWINTQTDSYGNAGNISIKAEKLTVSGEGGPYKEAVDIGKETITSAIVSSATEGSDGDGGNINIEVGQLILSGGAYIQTGTKSVGNAGEIEINKTGTITLMGISSDNQSSFIESSTYASTNFTKEKTGDGGLVSINAENINLLDGARISTSAISLKNGTGNAGDIIINTSGSIHLSGQNENASGHLEKGSGIYASSRQDINTFAGAAGKIILFADNLFMDDNAIISTSTNGLKDAGNIDIKVRNSVYISLSKIASESMMPLKNDQINGGAAGKITIIAEKDIRLFQFANITTDALSSGGGEININTGHALTILNSCVTTNVNQGAGNGGDINIRNDFTIMNHSIISANADAGDGGAIFIYTKNLIQSTDSIIEATSKRGNDGTVEIQTPDMDLNENLLNLTGNFLNIVKVVNTLCGKVSEGNSIQLVVNKAHAIPGTLDNLNDFSIYEHVSLISKNSLKELDLFDNFSKDFSDDYLFQNIIEETSR